MKKETMKKLTKSAMAFVLALVLAAANLGGTAEAASSVTDTYNGVMLHGSVSMGTITATAVTTYQASADISVTVTGYFGWGGAITPLPKTAYAPGGGASASVTRENYGSELLGATGHHIVKVPGFTWDKETSVGEVPGK